MPTVRIGGRLVGDGQPVAVIGELGINHGGDVATAKKLIGVCKAAGCWAVKFQKRTLDVVYSKEELDRPRESPYGSTNRDLKEQLEFDYEEYATIDEYCRSIGMVWFASPWDIASVNFLENFDPPCFKIASASLTDHELLRHVNSKGRPVILSTGMSSTQEVDDACSILGWQDLVLMACTASYPSAYRDLNLRRISTLRGRYNVPVGWSGHETGLASSIAAVALGIAALERHVTLDRSSYGSDQAASLEPRGLERLIRDVRLVEESMGSPEIRLLPCEEAVRDKLRRIK